MPNEELLKLVREELLKEVEGYKKHPASRRAGPEEEAIIEMESRDLADEVVEEFFRALHDKFDYFDSLVTDKLGMTLNDPRRFFARQILGRIKHKMNL